MADDPLIAEKYVHDDKAGEWLKLEYDTDQVGCLSLIELLVLPSNDCKVQYGTGG